MGYIARWRGLIRGIEIDDGRSVITAYFPLEMLFGYVADLRSLSNWRASTAITRSHFEQVTSFRSAKVLATVGRTTARSWSPPVL